MEGGVKLKCYPSVCTTVHALVLTCRYVCVYITIMCMSAYVSECALSQKEGKEEEGGRWGWVGWGE